MLVIKSSLTGKHFSYRVKSLMHSDIYKPHQMLILEFVFRETLLKVRVNYNLRKKIQFLIILSKFYYTHSRLLQPKFITQIAMLLVSFTKLMNESKSLSNVNVGHDFATSISHLLQ